MRVAPSARGSFAPLTAGIYALALLTLLCRPAAALVVESMAGTTAPPADDPGWNFITSQGRQFVYLGDSWALSAFHVGLPSVSESLHFPGGPFNIIKNQSFIVPNPAGSGLTTDTDLRLIRINGDLGTPSFTLASQPIFESTPITQREVTIIGHGPSRESTPSQWNVQVVPGSNNDIWTEVFPPDVGSYVGYKSLNPDDDLKRWGKNQIADEDSLFGGNDNDLRGTFQLHLGVGQRDVMSMVTTFDAAGLPQEAQAVAGDSGSAVLHKRNGQWQLIGVVNAHHSTFENQISRFAIYGNYTVFADLSYYHNEIMSIINANPNYSVMGDLNLDGSVTGDGTGPAATDDVTAFIQGWGYEQTEGSEASWKTSPSSITSWKNGDLNHDGRTDVSDFLLFRNAVNGTSSGAALAALMAPLVSGQLPSGVPEPASALLLLVGIGAGLAVRPPRRRV